PDPAARGAVKFRLASFLAWGTGSLDEAEVECRAALGLFKQAGDQRSALLAEHELAFVQGLRGDLPALRAGASRVAGAAAAGGDEFALRRATRTLAVTELMCGRFADAHRWGDQAMDLARRAGDRYAMLAGLASRAMLLAIEGRIAEAWGPLREAEAVDARWGDYWVHGSSCAVYWLAGEFSRAVSQGERALSLIPGTVSKRRAFGLAHAALSAAETGDLDTAAAIMDRVRPAYIEGDWFFHSDWIVHVDAMLRWRAQRPPEALTAMRGASERSVGIGVRPVAAMILGDVAEVAALDGDGAAAVRAARELSAIAHDVDRDLYRGLAGIAAAWAALASGDGSAAAGQAEAAVDVLSGLGYPVFCGRALDVLGRALSSENPRRAVQVLKAAAQTFAACGAVWRRGRGKAGRGEARPCGRHQGGGALGAVVAHPPGAGGRAAGRRRQHRPPDRGAAIHWRAHRRRPPGQGLRQARRRLQAAARRPRRRLRAHRRGAGEPGKHVPEPVVPRQTGPALAWSACVTVHRRAP